MKLKNLINEIDFSSQAAFDAYKEKHKVRDTTKVKIAGKETTAGAASKKSVSIPKGGASANSKKVEPKKAEEPKKEEPKSEPKQARKGNPQVNKKAKNSAEKAGITPEKLGNKEYVKTMYKAAVEALTDSNFHDEARELVAAIEGKPEWAKKVNYPRMDDPEYGEKMKAIKSGVDSSEYWDYDDNTRDYAVGVSQESGWDGVQAADGIAFTLRMNGFHKEADKIQSIFDNKPYMKALNKEGRLSLSSMIKESEAQEIGNLTGVRGSAVQKFIDDNNIDDRKLLAFLKIKGPKTLSNRMDISTAIVGKPNNKFAQGIIKAFGKQK
jgi:hypothetical protein